VRLRRIPYRRMARGGDKLWAKSPFRAVNALHWPSPRIASSRGPRAVKFDKDMMALFRAMKKASRPPAATIEQRRKSHDESGPPNESRVPDQNIEPRCCQSNANLSPFSRNEGRGLGF
jgi:hypothetical protein